MNLSVPVWELGVPTGAVMTRALITHANGFDTDAEQNRVNHGRLFVNLSAKSGCIYHYKFQ